MNGCLNIVAPLTFISETILLVTALALRRTKDVCRAYLPNLSLCNKHTSREPEMTLVKAAVRAKGSRSENIMILSIPRLILLFRKEFRKSEAPIFVLFFSYFLRLYIYSKKTLFLQDFQPFFDLAASSPQQSFRRSSWLFSSHVDPSAS